MLPTSLLFRSFLSMLSSSSIPSNFIPSSFFWTLRCSFFWLSASSHSLSSGSLSSDPTKTSLLRLIQFAFPSIAISVCPLTDCSEQGGGGVSSLGGSQDVLPLRTGSAQRGGKKSSLKPSIPTQHKHTTSKLDNCNNPPLHNPATPPPPPCPTTPPSHHLATP